MQPLRKVWMNYFVFVQHIPFKECKALWKHHLFEGYYCHMSQVNCILTARLRVTSILEEESGTYKLHQINILLCPTYFLCEFLPMTTATECPCYASKASCLVIRLLQFLPEMNMNSYKSSKDWSAIFQKDFLETHVCGDSCLLFVVLAFCRQRGNWLCPWRSFEVWASSEVWVKALSQQGLVCSSMDV